MTEYLLKAALCSLLFFALYKLLLEREHMYRFNRIYLLGSLVASLLVPLVTFTVVEEMPVIAPYTGGEILFDKFVEDGAFEALNARPFDWGTLLVHIYFAVTTLMLLRFLWSMVSICVCIRKSEVVRDGKAVIVLVDDDIVPHTFLKYIFINRDDYRNNRIEHEILLHEWVHAAQRHSLDKIIVELLIVMMWFNPVIYLYKRSIYLNHEFLADEGVLSRFDDLASYQNLLIHRFNGAGRYPVASPFSFLITKKRLIMMTKKTSRGRSLTKALATLPMLAVAVFAFSGRTVVYAQPTANPDTGIADFSLLVEDAGDKTKITSLGGTAFKELEFTLREGQTRQIHSSGMVGAEDRAEGVDTESFRFLITKTKDEYQLQAIKGTKWLKLGFGSSEGAVAYVNESGVETGPDMKDKHIADPERMDKIMNKVKERMSLTQGEIKFDEFTEDPEPEVTQIEVYTKESDPNRQILKGVVSDDLGPLMRVSVYLVTSRGGVARRGVMTDHNGAYVLDIGKLPKYPEGQTYTIMFSSPGYITKQFPYEGQAKMDVKMELTPESAAMGQAYFEEGMARAKAQKLEREREFFGGVDVVSATTNKIIRGVVKDDLGGLQHASVYLENSEGRVKKGTTTDHNGAFMIIAPRDTKGYTLGVSRPGYVTRKIAYEDQSQIEVTLTSARDAQEDMLIVAESETADGVVTGRAATRRIISGTDPGSIGTMRVRGMSGAPPRGGRWRTPEFVEVR